MIETVDERPIRYARLRAGDAWLSDVTFVDLDVEPGGDVVLRRVPSVSPPSVAVPEGVAASGLALDRDCGLYVSDAVAGHVLRIGLDCDDRTAVALAPGHAPAGLCIGPFGWLLVADPAGERVLVFSTPALELRDEWRISGARPTVLACEGDGVVFLDAATGRVRRLGSAGLLDTGFDARWSPPLGCGAVRAIAVDASGTLFVSCVDAPGVMRYDRTGASAGATLAVAIRPQALAVSRDVLYAADLTTGEVHLFSLPDGAPRGEIAGFVGPASALAVADDGTLYIKRGADEAYVIARPSRAHVRRGQLVTGRLDAGASASWHRAVVRAHEPTNTAVRLETFASDDASATPSWASAGVTDVRVQPRRYLWLRVTLESERPDTSPRVQQLGAESTGDSYIRYLPAVYSRADDAADDAEDPSETSRPIQDLLALARAILGDLELSIDELGRSFDARTAPFELLEWLAAWQAFEVPARVRARQDPAELRALLARIPEINARRGTLEGFRDLVELDTGMRPDVIESFHGRAVWVLGVTSALGWDTGLPRASLDEAVVDETALGSTTVGPSGGIGRAMFEETAHRFTVIVPRAMVPTEDARAAFRRAVEEHKPAHTYAHVCFTAPRLRVGVQARVGLDAIVADVELAALDRGDALGRGARLAVDPPGAAGAVERRARIGIDTRLG